MKRLQESLARLMAQLKMISHVLRHQRAPQQEKIRLWFKQFQTACIEGGRAVSDQFEELRLELEQAQAGQTGPQTQAETLAASAGDDPAKLRAALAQFTREHVKLRRQSQRLVDRCKALRLERRESQTRLTAAAAVVQAGQQEVASLGDELRRAQAWGHESTEKSHRLEQEAAALRAACAELEQHGANQETRLQAAVEQARLSEDRATQLAAALDALRMDHTQQAAHLQATEQQLTDIGNTRALLEAELQEERARGAESTARWQQTEASTEELRHQLACAASETDALHKHCAHLQESLEQAQLRWTQTQAQEYELAALRYFSCLQDDGALKAWREEIERRARAGHIAAIQTDAHARCCRAEAARIMSGSSALSGDPRPLLLALQELSRHLYVLLAESGHSAESSTAIAEQWAGALAVDLGGHIRFRVPQPGEPVSAQWMIFRHGTTVRAARTWAVGTPGASGLTLPAEVDTVSSEPSARRLSAT